MHYRSKSTILPVNVCVHDCETRIWIKLKPRTGQNLNCLIQFVPILFYQFNHTLFILSEQVISCG